MKKLLERRRKRLASVLRVESSQLAQSGDRVAAIEKLQQACAKYDAESSWHQALARLLEAEDRIGEALQENAIALELEQAPHASWYAHRGRMLARQGSNAEALIAYRQALSGEEVQPAWHAQYAQLLYQAGALDEALESFDRAIALDDKVPVWRAEREMVLDSINNPGKGGESNRTKERHADWYNTVYEASDEYQQSYTDSVYIDVWLKIVEMIKNRGGKKILEIGCGSGQLARAIFDQLGKLDYLGIDFAAAAIEIARRNCPEFDFRVANAFEKQLYADKKFDLVLSTEVLEHIENDLELLNLLPRGTDFIGTVPDFDSYSHVRYFKDSVQVEARYGAILQGFFIEEIPLESGRIYLFGGRKK